MAAVAARDLWPVVVARPSSFVPDAQTLNGGSLPLVVVVVVDLKRKEKNGDVR